MSTLTKVLERNVAQIEKNAASFRAIFVAVTELHP